MFTLGLSNSSFQMFSGGLTAPNETVLPTDMYRDAKFCIISEGNMTKEIIMFQNCVHTCAAIYGVNCLSHAKSFWTACNLCCFRCRFFRINLSTVICSICNSELAWEFDFFPLCSKACLTQSTSSSDLMGHPEDHLSSTLPVSINCSYHPQMLVSSGSVT
jgi:hypothetical protein